MSKYLESQTLNSAVFVEGPRHSWIPLVLVEVTHFLLNIIAHMNHYNKEVFHSNTLSTIALTLTWNTFQLQDLSLSFIASYWEPWIWLPAIQNMPCQTHLYSSPGKSYPLGWVSSAHSFDKTISKSASSEASLALKSMNECENRKSRTDVCSKFGRKKSVLHD